MVAHGSLTQWLSKFIAHGRADPRVETASSLLAAGVKLDRHVRKSVAPAKSGGCHAKFLYMNHRMNEDTDRATGSSHDANLARRAYCAEFEALPDEQKEHWGRKSKERRAYRLRSTVVADDEPDKIENGDLLCGLASQDLPLSFENFVSAAGADADSSFRSWGAAIQQEVLKSVFVEDSGVIPPKCKIKIPLSCHQEHPGVCVSADCEVLDVLLSAGSCLYSKVWEDDLALSWLQVDGAHRLRKCEVIGNLCAYVFCAHIRGSTPPVSLYLLAERECSRLCLKDPPVVCTEMGLMRRILSTEADIPLDDDMVNNCCGVYRKIATSVPLAAEPLAHHTVVSIQDPVVFIDSLFGGEVADLRVCQYVRIRISTYECGMAIFRQILITCYLILMMFNRCSLDFIGCLWIFVDFQK
jgi:hypothetical protein